jgi:hypothetical protein
MSRRYVTPAGFDRAMLLCLSILLAIAVAGCAPVPLGEIRGAKAIAEDSITKYKLIPEVILEGAASTYIILPRSIEVFDSSSFGSAIGPRSRRVIDSRDGLTSDITTIAYSTNRMWLGTTSGVFALETQGNILRKCAGSANPAENDIIWMRADEAGRIWVVTRGGVAFIDQAFGLGVYQSFPFKFSAEPRRELIQMDAEFVWVASANSIEHFSKLWQRWEPSLSVAEVGAQPLRLVLTGAQNLIAITEAGLFTYKRDSKTWGPAEFGLR